MPSKSNFPTIVPIVARYNGECYECRATIVAGDKAYYDGSERKTYCEECGRELKDQLGE